jgi:SpoVK/Ycf46/Vps4 family AAA+-type ATPase
MHTVIEGPPGVGKTLLGKILAKIYHKLDFLKKLEKNKDDDEINEIANHFLAILNPTMQPKKEVEKNNDFKFKVVRRSDLVGQYVGSTAIKTQKVIDEALGGVLFIDEVYSLGSGNRNERGDSFAKEAIDTLNQNLSENGDKFICIIAGYPEEVERCFFSQNEGLKRRFPFKYTIEKYDSKELSEIFEFKVKEINWNLHKDLKLTEVEKFIEKNKKSFEHFGGDIETLLLNIKIKHSLRIFGKHPSLRKLITMEDIKLAFDEYLKIRKEKELPQFVKDMYT